MINKQKIKYITQRAILTGTLSLTLLSGKTINTNAHEIKYFSELAVGCCDVWIGYVGGFYGLG